MLKRGSCLTLLLWFLILFSFPAQAGSWEAFWQSAGRMMRQLGYAPEFLRRIHAIVDEEYANRVLDSHLHAYWGFHQSSEIPHYRMRAWIPVRPSEIARDQVVGMPWEEFAGWARMAMEIEEPIMLYSFESGAGFRIVLPGLGRFMGRDPESRARAERAGEAWCDSAWCEEEKRHAPALKAIYERLTGKKLTPHENPNAVRTDFARTVEEALSHVDSRMETEWSASSTYAALLAHTKGPLHDFFRNAFRDEVKHLAIISAADRYLRGPRPWRRLAAMIASLRQLVSHHTEHRSGVSETSRNKVMLAEILYAHLLVEIRMRQWLETLPHVVLRKLFETPSRLPGPGLGEKLARDPFEHWKPEHRKEAEAFLAYFDGEEASLRHEAELEFEGFRGAEDPGSKEGKAMLRRVQYARLTARKRAAMYALLRESQIWNCFEARTLRREIEPQRGWHNLKTFAAAGCPSRLATGQ